MNALPPSRIVIRKMRSTSFQVLGIEPTVLWLLVRANTEISRSIITLIWVIQKIVSLQLTSISKDMGNQRKDKFHSTQKRRTRSHHVRMIHLLSVTFRKRREMMFAEILNYAQGIASKTKLLHAIVGVIWRAEIARHQLSSSNGFSRVI